MASVHVAIDPRYAEEIQSDPEKIALLGAVATDFNEFLKVWRFLDQRTGVVRVLGEELWSGQLAFVEKVQTVNMLYALKARKLGYTTIEQAYDAWCLRFRDGAVNARVHLFSRRMDAANELLAAVMFGLDRLPKWMQLPKGKDTANEVHLLAGPEDKRILKAYPADEETAVEATCNHGHVDEWARMGNPRKVYQAIEPSMAGSCHIITTGLGPNNYSADWWTQSMKGETVFEPFFVGALNRPDRDAKWLEEKIRTMPERERKHEYPMKWEEALFGGADLLFQQYLGTATTDARGLGPARPGRKYVKGWDVGRHADAAVCVVLDVTDDVADVVYYLRLRDTPYPEIQRRMEMVHILYPGLTVVEKNAAGEAVLENTAIPESQKLGFSTTGMSKPRIIGKLQVAFSNQVLKYREADCQQLHVELGLYTIPDDKLVQDSVMALAIAYEHAAAAHFSGKVSRIQTW